MVRVARALAQYAPPSVELLDSPSGADLVVSHVIGYGPTPDTPEAIIQYCVNSTGEGLEWWKERWHKARLVWSYYDLEVHTPRNFYFAPLGVDASFTQGQETPRDIGIMTSGFVSGPGAEAIEEAWSAASTVGLRALHLGPPQIEGMRVPPPRWTSVCGVTDEELAALYHRCEWVSGLRHVEGFELPVIEGLCCGARPIVFDRPDMTTWYEGHAAFVPECEGVELAEVLTEVLRHVPVPVSQQEREIVAATFNWATIARGFWERLGV